MDDIITFWDSKTVDQTYGGYLTMFDRTGRSYGTNKNMWCQGRQLYMFSVLYNQLGGLDRWLELGAVGRDFVVDHGYRGDGSWHYLLDQEGQVLDDSPSLFTDIFVLMGLCQYAGATGNGQDGDLIEATYGRIEEHLHEPGFNQYHHFDLDGRYVWHAPSMAAVGMAEAVRPVLGDDRLRPLIDRCLERMLHVLANDERQALFEVVQPDGSVLETDLGLTLNPGHAIESMWFCMEEGRRRNDDAIVRRASEILQWSYQLGYDEQYGGLLAFVDPEGGAPPGFEKPNKFGEAWDDKIWWVHAEALYGLLLAAVLTDDVGVLDQFLDMHEFCRGHFIDSEYGEWPCYLDRDGAPQEGGKGTQIRSAFHIPRSLMKLILLLENQTADEVSP